MNAFGIDYDRAISVACIREGTGPRARTRLVGDGFRASIPHAVSAPPAAPSEEDPVRWASRALETNAGASLRPAQSSSGPWLETPGALLFWRGLMRRLTAYIGRIKPLPSNGYDMVVAIQTSDLSRTPKELRNLCHEAGFEDVTVVPAPHALLCRWMTEAVLMSWGEGAQTIASVCVGDDSISVCAYRVTMRGTQMPQVTTTSRCFSINGCGGAWWTNRLLEEVANRWRETPDIGDETALRDAASEFGARLTRVSDDEQVEWEGPLAERMFEKLRLSRRECRDWPEVTPLLRQLPDILREAAQAVSGRDRLDLILVGGVGAMWPFAADVAATQGRIWQSGFPLEDVARGAACWTEAGDANCSMLPLDGSPAGFELFSSPSNFSSDPITLEVGTIYTSELSLETYEMTYAESGDPADFSIAAAKPEEIKAEEEAPDDTPDETEDEMPPSQRWRVN